MLIASSIFLLIQLAPYQPVLASLVERLGISRQEVVGREVRITTWAITANSERTAAAAWVDRTTNLVPMIMQTANGLSRA